MWFSCFTVFQDASAKKNSSSATFCPPHRPSLSRVFSHSFPFAGQALARRIQTFRLTFSVPLFMQWHPHFVLADSRPLRTIIQRHRCNIYCAFAFCLFCFFSVYIFTLAFSSLFRFVRYAFLIILFDFFVLLSVLQI